MTPPYVSLEELLDRHDGFLIDAYGVLNDAGGALPGAAALVGELERRGLPWVVLTNDSARLPSTIAARLTGFGVPVPVARVVSSGVLVAPYFAARGLIGRRTIVLGTDDSRRLVADAGGALVAPGEACDVIVCADDDGYEFLPSVDATVSSAVRALDAGVALELVLPNPDLVYPKPGGDYGVTTGAVAMLIEAALHRLRPGAPRFVPLGKPNPPIYAEAARRLGPTTRALAIGDSVETDVAGALAAGIEVALVDGGVSRWRPGDPEPTCRLAHL